jgi:phosphate transport system permease protein
MTTTTSSPPAGPPPSAPELADWIGARPTSPRRRYANLLASVWMVGSVAVALIPLGFIAFHVVAKGIAVISWSFLTKDIPIISILPGGGIWPAIAGTLLLTATAAAMAIPLGVLAAIYLNEYGKQQPTARVIRFMADVMTGVPSIVMGLFVALIWVSAGLHKGFSTFAGALALACLMLPIVIRSSEEMLKLVPDDLRQASDGIGARRSQTVIRVVVPAALPGIVSGAMLAVARAAGETAPLLFTIGVSRQFHPNLGARNTALPIVIWNNAQDAVPASQNRAWGAALTLITIVFVLTVIARLVSARFATRTNG